LALLATKRSLPGRGGRNEHPGAVAGAGPAPRRKTQEVTAERAGRKQAADDKARQEAAAKSHLAQWQLVEEDEDHEMEAESFKRYTGVLGRQQQAEESSGNSGEEFEFVNDTGLSSQDEEVGKQSVKKVGLSSRV
jgi:hypothetical protein